MLFHRHLAFIGLVDKSKEQSLIPVGDFCDLPDACVIFILDVWYPISVEGLLSHLRCSITICSFTGMCQVFVFLVSGFIFSCAVTYMFFRSVCWILYLRGIDSYWNGSTLFSIRLSLSPVVQMSVSFLSAFIAFTFNFPPARDFLCSIACAVPC